MSASELECGTLGKECTLWGFGKILGMVEKNKLVMMTLHVPDVWKENSKTSHEAAPRLLTGYKRRECVKNRCATLAVATVTGKTR